jgi:DNA integrity scanning protein DisA with diadenylate cyclase activity
LSWHLSSTVDHVPDDPVGAAVAESIAEMLRWSTVELLYSPADTPPPPQPDEPATASATGPGPPGWRITLTVRLRSRIAPLMTPASMPLLEFLRVVPGAGLRAAARLSTSQAASADGAGAALLTPALRRALRDTIVVEALSRHPACDCDSAVSADLIANTVEYLIELSGTRVESHDLTHGVVITDVLQDTPRLRFDYPADLRAAKRAPLLFDGQRSLLIVDREGRARTELQGHRLDRLVPGAARLDADAAAFSDTGSLVGEATRRLGGVGLFLSADRTIWVFASGQPLLLRRGEHWTAFPLELATAVANASGARDVAADILVRAAFIISAQRSGAILAIVADPNSLDGIVSAKDRYDLRNAADPSAMQTETRLHHLIDAGNLDAQTLARFAALDGATILDRDGNLLAYGAIVTSADSNHEGARTAAATTLSQTAEIVLKVSVDGDITVFRAGEAIATLLG